MRVLVHIGTEKTGTSTIQSFLSVNRERLKETRILYPSGAVGPDAPSHLKLVAFARDDDRRCADVHDKLGVKSLLDFRKDFQKSFYEECNAEKFDYVVLSSEHLSSRLNRKTEIQRLKSLLEPLGKCDIVLYLRAQEELVVSAYSTSVWVGSTKKFSAFLDGATTQPYYDYKLLCDMWADVFGDDSLKVRIFSKSEFVDGDLIRDFIATSGIPVSLAACQIPPNQNESIGALYLEFLRQFNQYLPHMGRHTNFLRDPQQGNLLSIISQLNGGAKASLPFNIAQSFRSRFLGDNAYVAKKYLNREDGILFRTAQQAAPGNSSEEIDHELTTAQAFELFAKIWRKSVSR